MSSRAICVDSIQGGGTVDAAQRKEVRKVSRLRRQETHFRCRINALWAESAKPSEIFAEPREGMGAGAQDLSDRSRERAASLHETSCMSRRILSILPALRPCAAIGLGSMLVAAGALAAEPNFPITPQQRSTAQRAAEAGVPLSEINANAPDVYTVKRRDTLWDISKMYLKSPWRWPELWGMNLEQVRNPHLIYPGQVLYLDKSNGRARLRMGKPVGTTTERLQPRMRDESLESSAIASVPMHLIGPFLNEALVFGTNELDAAP